MSSELNIIELIERNPISKLSSTYNIKLLEKIKLSFTDTEQQLFVSSFYCYLNYDKNEFVVELDTIWKWIGFSQKVNAIRLLEKNFIVDIDYKNLALPESKVSSEDKKHGGHNIITYWLTIKCFKSICLKAQTKKAGEIHEYYMKLEELLHTIIEEEATEFKTKLEQKSLELTQKTEQLEQKSLELKLVPEQEKHKLIMKQFGFINGSLIYILRVKQLDSNKYIIKIGESRKGVRNRYNEFRIKYGQHVIFLDAFPVNNSAGFEKFLHGHDKIRPHKVTTFEGHEKENELFLIGEGLQYKCLVETIELNINHYDYSVADFEKLRAENEKLLLENTMLKTNQPTLALDSVLKDLVEMNKVLLSKVTALENYNLQKETKSEIQPAKITTILNKPDPHVGPRLQKINPDHLEQIVQVYESTTDAMKENHAIK
jgi:phage anti-repressor protein